MFQGGVFENVGLEAGDTIQREVAAGRIEDFGDGIRITDVERFFADPVMIAFL